MRDTAGEARTNSQVMFFYGPFNMDMAVLANSQELIYISSVQTQNVVWKTCQEQWMIGTDGEKESGNLCMTWWLWWTVENDIIITINIFEWFCRVEDPTLASTSPVYDIASFYKLIFWIDNNYNFLIIFLFTTYRRLFMTKNKIYFKLC